MKQHIASSGKNAGQWVACKATGKCRVGGQERTVQDSQSSTSGVAEKLNNLFKTDAFALPVPNNIAKLDYLNAEQAQFFLNELTRVNQLAEIYTHDYDADDVEDREGEKEFIDAYDPTEFTDKPISHTADNIIFTQGSNGKLKVLLIKRGGHPYKNMWAHPGGFIDEGEKASDAAVRELKEETNITMSPKFLQFVNTYDRKGRDPRMEVLMNTHVALIPKLPAYKGSDDAIQAKLVDVDAIYKPNSSIQMAFDHKQSIKDAITFLLKN